METQSSVLVFRKDNMLTFKTCTHTPPCQSAHMFSITSRCQAITIFEVIRFSERTSKIFSTTRWLVDFLMFLCDLMFTWIWFQLNLIELNKALNHHSASPLDAPSRRSAPRGCWLAPGSAWVTAPSSVRPWLWRPRRSASPQTSRYRCDTSNRRDCCYSDECNGNSVFKARERDITAPLKPDTSLYYYTFFYCCPAETLLNTVCSCSSAADSAKITCSCMLQYFWNLGPFFFSVFLGQQLLENACICQNRWFSVWNRKVSC